MERNGKEIHAEVERLRESGKPEESLRLAEEAKKVYLKERNVVGLSDLYGSISLAYRHLGDLEEAKKAAEEAVRVAKENNLKGDLARPLFNLAKVKEDLKDFGGAVEDYKESIKLFQEQNPTLHNRPGVLADMNIHLATCEYKANDKSGLERALSAIEDLKNSDEEQISKYNYDVWLSGAYMKIADILKKHNLEMAHEYLGKAKEIIDANPKLEIRKKQWEELSKSF